jgi:hypothetical protein
MYWRPLIGAVSAAIREFTFLPAFAWSRLSTSLLLSDT